MVVNNGPRISGFSIRTGACRRSRIRATRLKLRRLDRHRARKSRAGEPAIERLVRHFFAQDLAHSDQLLDIDARRKTLAFAQEHEVLEYDISRCARRERTAAETAERAVENTRTGIERSGSVGDAHAPCVVEMNADRLGAGEPDGGPGQIADLLRPGVTDRVGDADDVDARVKAFL